MMGIKKDTEQTLGAGGGVSCDVAIFDPMSLSYSQRWWEVLPAATSPPVLSEIIQTTPPPVVALIGLVISSGPLACEIEFTHVGTQLEDHAHMGTYRLGIHPSMPSCHQQP